MEAIDDLVAAPELATPPKVLRSRVLYEFADPDLETRSAGQKILLRMGPENAARGKDKLWQLRRGLTPASSRRPNPPSQRAPRRRPSPRPPAPRPAARHGP